MKVKEIIALLENDGWRFIRERGDHKVYWKESARRPIVVPGKMNDDLPKGTQNSILREANLK